MAKKLSMLVAAIAVLAFAIPGIASASTGLTENGTLLSVGSEVTGTNIGTVTTTSSIGNITCSNVMLLAEVTENSEANGVKAIGKGAGTATTCFWKGSVAIEITHVNLTELSSTAAETGSGKGSFSFEADLTKELTCKYTGTGAVGTYKSETDVIKFEKAKLTASPSACGTATLDGEFTLSTTNNTAVTIM